LTGIKDRHAPPVEKLRPKERQMIETLPELAINPDDAFYILMRAREFDEKVEETDPDSASNASDDNAVDILEDRPTDAAYDELVAAVDGLNDDAQLDLIALAWVGRGDFTLEDWQEARQAARDIGRQRAPRYIAEIPLVSDYLEEALSQFGLPLNEYLDRH